MEKITFDTWYERFTLHIASILDKPSVYMGGPSTKSKRQAEEILDELLYLRSLGYYDDFLQYI